MIVYFIFAVVLLIGYFHPKISSRYMIVVMIIFLGLRYHTGWDYWWYLAECKNVARTGTTNRELEGAWIYIFSIGKVFNSYWLPISLVGITTLLLIYSSLKRILKKGAYIKTALLFFAFYPDYYLATFSTIRQWLALSLCLYVFAYFYVSKKKSIALLLYIVTVLFSYQYLHGSSAIMLAFIPVYYAENLLKKHKTLYMLLLSVVLVLVFNAINVILASFPTQYAQYFGIEADFGKLMKYLVLGLLVFVLFYFKQLKVKNEINTYFYLFFIGSIISIAILFQNNISFINRISLYFTVCIIYFIPYVLDKIKMKKNITKVLYVTVLLVIFFFHLDRIQLTKASPGALDHYIPYKTVFSLL